jgi:outer membrane protein assembly factor BamA
LTAPRRPPPRPARPTPHACHAHGLHREHARPGESERARREPEHGRRNAADYRNVAADITNQNAGAPAATGGNANIITSDPLAQVNPDPLVADGGACDNLNPRELSGRTVNINYTVELGRRFRLSEIRIEGTEKLTYDDLADVLGSEPASGILGIIPFLGSRRGYTSRELLVRDQRTIRARMVDLGYRRAAVEVRQGVALDSEDLIITFAVTEGPLTRVAGLDFRGNQLYTTERLRDEPCRAANFRSEPCTIVEGPYARTLARADGERIRNLYARNGYVDAEVRVDVVELPRKGDDEQVRLVYNVTEGGKVFINRIIINGNEGTTPDASMRTKREAILEAIPLREGEVLRSDRLAEAERVLYETNAFRQVIIRTEAAGETAAGFRRRDVIIDIEELKPRRMDYGGGYSTDSGPLGLFEIRNNNLFGQLRQGALRTRASRRQQLLRLEYSTRASAPTAARASRRSTSRRSTSATSTSRASSAPRSIAATSASSSGSTRRAGRLTSSASARASRPSIASPSTSRRSASSSSVRARSSSCATTTRTCASSKSRVCSLRRFSNPTGPCASRASARPSRATRATASSTPRAASS